MHSEYFFYFISIILLFETVYSSDLTNLCSNNNLSCNCTLINNTDLNIICNSTTSLTQLPTLVPNTLQKNVIQLRISSLISGTKGPLIVLPTNICSYPNLARLDLSSNNINGSLNTSQLACLGLNLITVDFSYNSITGIDKNLFKLNPNLQTINLSHNNLTIMPSIDSETFVDFSSSLISMNFSFNQIINVDFWPLFVRTGNSMTIDMSYNSIVMYTNNVPISLEQFTDTPDPRIFYLNNNQLEYLSDLLLEQYGACSTTNPISTAYFIVGISNLLLTNNPLICDCQSYNLITYISDGINDFPQISNGSALLTQAMCSQPASMAGQPFLSTNFDQYDDCENYTLPEISNIFCSFATNDTAVTLPPPTYWPSTTLTTTIVYETNGSTGSGNHNSNGSSTSLSWYIILGVVLGLVVVLALIIGICYFCRDKFFPKRYHSKFLNHDGNSPNNSYEPIIRNSEMSLEKNLKLNGIKPHHASISTSTYGFDDQEKGTQQSNNDGLHSDRKSPRDHQSLNDGHHPEQETQTSFPPIRSKPPNGRPHSTRNSQQKDIQNTSHRESKLSLPPASDVATNTINVVKGIPIPSVLMKHQSLPTNGIDTSASELSVTSIPLTASKRAKILPQLNSGVYVDSTDDNLLNTSAGVLATNQRQGRRNSLWFRKQNQNMISPLPPRPRSMVAQKTIFDYEGSFDEDIPSVPTIESLTTKSSKPLRTVPLLNISVVPAWVDDSNEQT